MENILKTLKFTDLGLSESSVNVIAELGFETPTEIQQLAIPHLLTSEQDFVGQAQTGTGKTAAFVFPLIERINTSSENIQSLILAPTRELANQVCEEFKKLGAKSSIKTEAVFGGTPYDRQIRNIKRRKPHVIVGTPGRVMDLMNKGILKFENAEYVVLDEADEMLNMGFFEDVQEIIGKFSSEKRLWMFSATMPRPIENLIKKNFKEPFFVKTEAKTMGNDDIEQSYFLINRKYHKEALCRMLDFNPEMYGIVFCRTKLETRELSDDLLFKGYHIESLHGDMGQSERDFAMKNFKDRKARLMICTDVAARGIDVNSLTHVINYGLPQDFESYVHRIGRTGRAGLKGSAITLIDPRDERRLKQIERFTGKKISLAKLPSVDEMKALLVDRELTNLEGVIEAVSTKGDEFKLDGAYEIFSETFEDLSREEILKVMFTWNFNKSLRRLNDIGDLNCVREKSQRGGRRDQHGARGRRDQRGERGHRGQGNRRETSVGRTGNVRLFLNMGRGDGLRIGMLLDDLSKQTGLKKNDIQNVELKSKFSFLEVPEKFGNKMISKKDLQINRRKVHLELTHRN
jgi:ATP-dependent RNA helicase DeaD